MIIQGGIFAFWTPAKGISGSAQPGRVWVESINSIKGTALVRYDAGDGMRSRQFCARLLDLQQTARGWQPSREEADDAEPFRNGPDTNF